MPQGDKIAYFSDKKHHENDELLCAFFVLLHCNFENEVFIV